MNRKSKGAVWFFHHYATPPLLGGMTRPYEFAKRLNSLGFNCSVFGASYLHFLHKNLITDKARFIVDKERNVTFYFIRSPDYDGNGLSRVRNMLSYSFNLFPTACALVKKNIKPDIIYASSPHPLTLIAGIFIARRLNIPCICEIRDLWPENIFAYGQIKESSVLGKLLIRGERWIYKNADALIFTKEGDIDYLKERKWTTEQGGNISLLKCHYINNGVDLASFGNLQHNTSLQDPDLVNGKFNVVYTGAIRPVNNVGNILDAARYLRDETDIQFLIYGSGNEEEQLRKRVIDEGLSNVKFKGRVDKSFIPYILSKSSVNLLNYSNKYNWTRGNSSNKLFEYMASGKPIISTVKMGHCPLEKFRCGLSLPENNPQELAQMILQIRNMPQKEYDDMASHALIAARNFDYDLLTEKLFAVLTSVSREWDYSR